MASDQHFVDFVVQQMEHAAPVTFRKMFGEYALYKGGKVVALVCDNRLLVKPTEAGRAFIGDVVEAPPYPGAKPAFLIEAQLEDREWLGKLITITERELPEPRPKKKRKKKPK
jgi:TfoX/Sxy family transcriptional regulator of competence genes